MVITELCAGYLYARGAESFQPFIHSPVRKPISSTGLWIPHLVEEWKKITNLSGAEEEADLEILC